MNHMHSTHPPRGNEILPIQLAQCWFPGLAIFNAKHKPVYWPFSRTTCVSQNQKGETNLDYTEEETVSGSGISWAICKSAPL